MKITVLCESVAGHENRRKCLAEWGFSVFIEHENAKILFDTGHTDAYTISK